MKIDPSINKLDTLKYITMDHKNLIYKNTINPVHTDYIFLFDIDDTLYKSTDLMDQAEMKKWKFAYDHFKGDRTDIPDFNTFLNSTTLYSEAFKLHFNVDPYEVETVKGFLDYKEYVFKDDILKSFLTNLKYRKWCFTNGMKCRADPILECLDLKDTFEGVICMDNLCFKTVLGKPKEEAYKFVEELLQIKDKSKVFFFDDSLINIEMGIKMGWRSYLVKKDENIVDLLKSILVDEVER